MENIGEPTGKSLPLSTVVPIDRICGRFDHAVKAAIQNRGRCPSIEEYLGDTTERVRSQLRKELLAVKASYRQQRTEDGDPDLRSESRPATRLWQRGESESWQTGDDTMPGGTWPRSRSGAERLESKPSARVALRGTFCDPKAVDNRVDLRFFSIKEPR
jgi:hypothetical protein